MSAFTITTTCEGNLVKDPVLRETSGGKPVANMRIAVTSRVRVGANDFVDKTEYINVVAWGSQAVNASASLHQGDRVVVSGDLKQRSFTGKDGNDRYVTEIHTSMIGVSLRWHVVAGIEKANEALASAPADSEPALDPIYDEA